MIDLVAARLTGEGGARAADPGSVMAAWRRAAGSRGRRSPRARRARTGPPARRRPAPARRRRGYDGSRRPQRLAAPGRGRTAAGRGEGRRRRGQPAPAGGPADRPAHHRGDGHVARAGGPGQPAASGAPALPRGVRRRTAAPTTPTRSPGSIRPSIWTRRSRSPASDSRAPPDGPRRPERAGGDWSVRWASRDRLSPCRPGTAAGRSGAGPSGRLTADEAPGLVGARGGSRARPAGAVVRAGRRVLPRGALPADRVHPAAGGGGLPPVGGAGLGDRTVGAPARARPAGGTTARRSGAWPPCTWPATRAASCWASIAGASPRGCTTSRR